MKEVPEEINTSLKICKKCGVNYKQSHTCKKDDLEFLKAFLGMK